MAAVASSVVHEVLGHRAVDVDKPIIDYIINVLADEDFDFGVDGNGAFEAVGDLLVDSGCVENYEEGRLACSKISEKFGKHGLVKPKEAVRSLATPLRMFDGMDDGEPVKKKVELLDGPVLTERDRVKLERRKRKEERQREAQYQMHLKEMEAVKAGMPVVSVRHEGDGGSAAKDIHMENFNISVGGRDLITDASVTLSFGRHYGLVGRNGTGKTSFLRHLAMHVFMVFLGTAKYYMWNNKLWEIIHQLCSVSLMLTLKGHSCWKKPSYFLNRFFWCLFDILSEQFYHREREIWSMKLNLGIVMDILKGALTKMLFQDGLKKCIKGSNLRFTWPYFIGIMLMGSMYLPTLFFIWCCASRW